MTDKTCPFKQGLRFDTRISAINVFANERMCDGEGCQMWVKLCKDRILVTGRHSKMADPDAHYVYEGCGLVTAIPWMLVNKVKKS